MLEISAPAKKLQAMQFFGYGNINVCFSCPSPSPERVELSRPSDRPNTFNHPEEGYTNSGDNKDVSIVRLVNVKNVYSVFLQEHGCYENRTH